MKNYICYLKSSIIILLMIIINSNSFGQLSTDMIKYWYYRDRLKYFVVPGEKWGESQLICVRNHYDADNDANPSYIDRSKNVDYGQHGKYTGLYWGVLATEYYLLNDNGQYNDAAITENELHMALNAYKVYRDSLAEQYWDEDNSFNGFFIRGNVPCNFFNPDDYNGVTISGKKHIDLLNKLKNTIL